MPTRLFTRRTLVLTSLVWAAGALAGMKTALAETANEIEQPVRPVWFKALDEDGKSVANIPMTFSGRNPDKSRMRHFVRTDGEGYFVTNFVVGTTYRVHLSPGLNMPYHFSITGVVGETSGLTKDEPVRLAVSRSRRLRGRVVDEKGRPVAGARVQGSGFSKKDGSIGGAHTMSSDDGAFDVQSIIPGTHIVVWARKKGFMPMELMLPPVDHDDLVLRMKPDTRVTLRCRLIDSGGDGGVVIPHDGRGSLQEPERWQGVHVKGGEFVLANLSAGEHRLLLPELETVDGWELTNAVFAVTPGMARQKDFHAARIPETTILVRERGTRRAVGGVSIRYGRRMPQRIVSDADGLAKVRVTRNEAVAEVDDRDYAGTSRSVALKQGRTNELLVTRRVGLAGRVTDGKGKPVGDALVAVVETNGNEETANTGEDGRFFVGGLESAPVLVVVRAEGFAPWTGEVKPPWKRELAIVLSEGVEVRFAVDVKAERAKNENISDGTVIVFDAKKALPVATAWQRGEGNDLPVRLNPGVYPVVWAGKEAALRLPDIVVKEAGEVAIEIAPPADGNVKTLEAVWKELRKQ